MATPAGASAEAATLAFFAGGPAVLAGLGVFLGGMVVLAGSCRLSWEMVPVTTRRGANQRKSSFRSSLSGVCRASTRKESPTGIEWRHVRRRESRGFVIVLLSILSSFKISNSLHLVQLR